MKKGCPKDYSLGSPLNSKSELLVALHCGHFSCPLHSLAFKGFLLAIQDGGGFLEKLPLLPLSDDAFLFHLALEALYGFFEGLIIAYFDVGYGNHLPSVLLRHSMSMKSALLSRRGPFTSKSGSTAMPMSSTSQWR